MNTTTSTRKITRALCASSLLFAFTASPLVAQTTYTAVDLTPTGSGSAQAASARQAAGYATPAANSFTGHATLWTGDGAIDLHPETVVGAGRSAVAGFAGNLQVGSAAGPVTANRNFPCAWRDSAASATLLNIPFVNAGGQANATDGVQIVGYAIGLDRDGTTLGSSHALIWNVATGTAVDIGTDANLLGVAKGQQVGIVLKTIANAALWRGTKAYTLLHPKNAVVSYASATDGVRQVGYAGFDIRVRVEAVKGAKDRRLNYAHVWTGTAASALNIHPYASNADGVLLDHSYATAVSGSWIAGYANVATGTNTIGLARALVWDSNYQATDLQAFVPAGFISSVAYAVDADGNVAGAMSKADGSRHAVMWIPNR